MRGYDIRCAFHKMLGFQAIFTRTIQNPLRSFHTASSIAPHDPDIDRTISFWFGGPQPETKWFNGSPTFDAEIKDQFGSLVEKARAEKLGSWSTEPMGTLALVILLDQFPRNMFRGTPLAFSSDHQARNITTIAIAKGFDRQVSHTQQSFLYLPLMHDENLLSQIASQIANIALTELAISRCGSADSEVLEFWKKSLRFSLSHRDPILRFGRFPSRNDILGRTFTKDEIAYLRENPSGFGSMT